MSDTTDSTKNDGDQGSKQASGGDDERENREQIERTGEPIRDELGNADGAS